MATNLKTFKTYSAARKAAAPTGGIIVRVAGIYLVGFHHDFLDSIEVINPNGHVVANVTARHLMRLGNANWAVAGKVGVSPNGNPKV